MCERCADDWAWMEGLDSNMSHESFEQREVNDLIEKIKEAKQELRRLEAQLVLAQIELEIANG